MATGIVRVTDRNFRITIPEDIREVEDINQGDYIQIDVIKLDLKKSLNDSITILNDKLDKLPDRISDAIKKKYEDEE